MIHIHTFVNVRMVSGPNADIQLFSYGETDTYGRWMLKRVNGEPVDVTDIHNGQRGSRRSELKAAFEAYLGFPVNLHDLLASPPAGSQAEAAWPNTWGKS